MILMPLWLALVVAGALLLLGASVMWLLHDGRCERGLDCAYDQGWDAAISAATAHQLADAGLLVEAGLAGAGPYYRYQGRHQGQRPAGAQPPQHAVRVAKVESGQRVAWWVFRRGVGRAVIADRGQVTS